MSTWSFVTQSCGFYHLACICVRRGEWEKALAFAEKSLAGNNHNQRARTLKAELMKQVWGKGIKKSSLVSAATAR